MSQYNTLYLAIMYQTEEFGLFIALTTANYQNLDGFVKEEISKPFETYRNKLKRLCSTLSKEDQDLEAYFKYLYTPKVYGVFSSFDLMTLALVDDFAFATRYFHPFNSNLRKLGYDGKNYTFHVITGLCPRLQSAEDKETTLLDKAQQIFLKDTLDTYPFVGNLSLKLNNALLIGSSGSLVDLILSKLYDVLEADEKVLSIIYHSLSWNEISILIFSDSLEYISNKILQVRELNFGSLKKDDDSNELYHQVIEKSLLNFALPTKEKENIEDYFYHTHLFVHTHSIFGYDLNLLSLDRRHQLNLKDKIDLLVRWEIKPGHLRSIQNDFFSKYIQGLIASGRADYLVYIDKEDSLKKYWDVVHGSLQGDTRKHFRKITTMPGFPGVDTNQVGEYFPIEQQFLLHDNLSNYSFSIQRINQIRFILKQLRFPVTLQDKISRMFVIYNDGIHDPILYGYFIELKPYLITIEQVLKKYHNSNKIDKIITQRSVDQLVKEIKPWVKTFEEAYKNRFGQSYIMNEITDFNLEFTGGIQQLISAYDGAYKSFTNLLGEDFSRSIVYISSEPNVESDKYSVRLNYFHLFQPEFFAAAATHEAANFYIERIGRNKQKGYNGIENIVSKYKELMDKISKENCSVLDAAAGYFIRDIFTLHLAYNCDFDLFFFWHWACFLQTGIFYNTIGDIDQAAFNNFMARMFLLDKYINPENSYFSKQLFPPHTLYSTSIQKAWENALITIKPKLNEEISKHEQYFSELQDLSIYLVVKEFGVDDNDDNTALFNLVKQVTNDEIEKAFYEKKYPKIINGKDFDEKKIEYYMHLATARYTRVKKISDIMIADFEKSIIYNLNNIQKLPYCPENAEPSFYYHILFFTYLKYVKEKIADNSWGLIGRNTKNGQIIKNPQPARLQIDPFGGLFSANVESRKKLIQARAIFLKTMWDFSIQMKIEQFKFDSDLDK